MFLQEFNILFSAVEARLPSLARGGWCECSRGEWVVGDHLHGYAVSSRPVAITNRMEARTALKFGSSFDHLLVTFLPGRRIYYLYEY
jgi:hypothetical protein